MALLYGRAGRLTAKNGGFRPGKRRKEHELVADMYDFWVYNGQSASQHLWMRIYEVRAAGALAV